MRRLFGEDTNVGPSATKSKVIYKIVLSIGIRRSFAQDDTAFYGNKGGRRRRRNEESPLMFTEIVRTLFSIEILPLLNQRINVKIPDYKKFIPFVSLPKQPVAINFFGTISINW
jgi:hypothetical protein